MSRFSHVLNVKTRAIAPDYVSQWYDRVFSFDSIPEGVDFIDVEYPYSSGNRQVIDGPFSVAGDINESTLLTIAGDAIFTIEGEQMRRIG